MTENTINDPLGTLIADFMQAEKCEQAVAEHAVVRVCQFLGLRDVRDLPATLEQLEAETLTASGIGVRQARLLRCFFDTAIIGVLPAARRALTTILANAEHITLVDEVRH
jgi:hypothetical protein